LSPLEVRLLAYERLSYIYGFSPKEIDESDFSMMEGYLAISGLRNSTGKKERSELDGRN